MRLLKSHVDPCSAVYFFFYCWSCRLVCCYTAPMLMPKLKQLLQQYRSNFAIDTNAKTLDFDKTDSFEC